MGLKNICKMPQSVTMMTHAPAKKLNDFINNIEVVHSTNLMLLTHCLIKIWHTTVPVNRERQPSRIECKTVSITGLQKSLEGR